MREKGDKLAVRVRAKVRKKWGGSGPDLPSDDVYPDPRLLGIKAAATSDLPKNLITSIERLPKYNSHTEFAVALNLNECDIRLDVTVSDMSTTFFKGEASRLLVAEIIDKSSAALLSTIREALIRDLELFHGKWGKAWMGGVG